MSFPSTGVTTAVHPTFPNGPRRIGRSGEGRPIEARLLGAPNAPLRLMIVAGQHGDEPHARWAVERFARTWLRRGPVAARLQVALVADINPDGSVRHIRQNACGGDLNRDHQLLAHAETRALHQFVRSWQPHVVVDVHTYPPRRKHLLRDHLVYCHDVMVDWPTHRADSDPQRDRCDRQRIERLCRSIDDDTYRAGRYTLVTASGRVRHSTSDVVDARNGLALRYGVQTLLVEGREPTRHDNTAAAARLMRALDATLIRIAQWASEPSDTLARTEELGPSLPVRCRYRRTPLPCRMAFQNSHTGRVRTVALPGPYTPSLSVTATVRPPRAYAVPLTSARLVDVLRRHAFPEEATGGRSEQRVEFYCIDRVVPSSRPGRAPRKIAIRARTEWQQLDSYAVFPVAGRGGRALCIFLEPESKYGLHRNKEAGLPMVPGRDYPVLRVV